MKDMASILSLANLDVHVHSPYSECCADITLEKLRQKAKEKNIIYAITDHSSHLYFPREMAWCMHFNDNFKELWEQYRVSGRESILKYIKEMKAGAPLTGVELDIYPDGTLIFEEDLFGKLDIVLGAVHFLSAVKKKQSAEEIIKEFRYLTEIIVSSGRIHVLAHPFRILATNKIPVADELIKWTLELCAAYEVAVEINSHYKYPENDSRMLIAALERNVRIVYGSDAHFLREFGDYSYHEQICSINVNRFNIY